MWVCRQGDYYYRQQENHSSNCNLFNDSTNAVDVNHFQVKPFYGTGFGAPEPKISQNLSVWCTNVHQSDTTLKALT